MNDKKLLTVKDVQMELGISRDLTYRLMHSAGFPTLKIGKKFYVERTLLDNWIEKYSFREFKLCSKRG